MKSVLVILAFVLLLGRQCGFSQGFVNLDFEAAYPNIQPTSPSGFYDALTALPDWTVYFGTNQQSEVGYNIISTGATFVGLVGTNDPYISPISGRYSALLEGGVTAPNAGISQTGLVPASAESILFEGQGYGSLILSMGDQVLPFFTVGTGSGYTLYGADISAFEGQTEQLTFSVPEGNNGNNLWLLDNIQFSSVPVPEPRGFALGALGALLLGFRRWRNSSRKATGQSQFHSRINSFCSSGSTFNFAPRLPPVRWCACSSSSCRKVSPPR